MSISDQIWQERRLREVLQDCNKMTQILMDCMDIHGFFWWIFITFRIPALTTVRIFTTFRIRKVDPKSCKEISLTQL